MYYYEKKNKVQGEQCGMAWKVIIDVDTETQVWVIYYLKHQQDYLQNSKAIHYTDNIISTEKKKDM